jgi:Flp pilus assembly pilin Flp
MIRLVVIRGGHLSGMFHILGCFSRRYRAVLVDMGRDRKGTTAVEFALIATPLILLIFACLELSLFVVVNVSLDNATQSAAREIRMDARQFILDLLPTASLRQDGLAGWRMHEQSQA